MAKHLLLDYTQNLPYYELTKKENIFTSPYIRKYKARTFYRKAHITTSNPSSLVYIKQLIRTGRITIAWRDLNTITKLFFIFCYCELQNFKTITIDFSENMLNKLEKTSQKADFIRRRINANFKNIYGCFPIYSFIMERNKDNRLHMHGIMFIPDIERTTIRNVLKRTCFGTNYKQSSFNKYILEIKNLTEAECWTSYCLKNKFSQKIKLEVYISRRLIQETKTLYNFMKENQDEQLKKLNPFE